MTCELHLICYLLLSYSLHIYLEIFFYEPTILQLSMYYIGIMYYLVGFFFL